jgi:hypothetical protein
MRKAIFLTAGLLLAPATGPASAATDGRVTEGELHIIDLAEFNVPIIDASRADGRLLVKLAVETHGTAAAEGIKARLPALRAESLAATLEFARLHASPLTPVDAERLASDLTSALHRSGSRIERVLIVGIRAQRS